MRRSELEHVIRAAAAITNEYEIVVVGSQSLLGAVPEPSALLMASMEADVYPLHRPDLADLIDGAIGEGSPFHDCFGYYAQGVGPETAILPVGWQDRLVRIQNPNTDLKVGLCLEPHDLAASKLAAGREKDWDFVAEMLASQVADHAVLLERIAQLPLPIDRKNRLAAWVSAH
ncbi:MAG: hypothetical protein IPH37_06045 [Burkholderiales bacterium]|nr:hypothetical protein [Burkholderiales bacterium]MBP8053232.1 hypothetical protein [Burkholderiaceae bacterium]